MMIPMGYMAKKVVERPDYLKNQAVLDIYSVSNCVNDDFADFIGQWKHNGYFLFDTPTIIREVATIASVDLREMQFFYYEAYDHEYDDVAKQWVLFEPDGGVKTSPVAPSNKHLQGYDIVAVENRSGVSRQPNHSPLSCNSLSEIIPVNEHCLLPSIEKSKELLESGTFDDSEPGPYRIFAVYTVTQ